MTFQNRMGQCWTFNIYFSLFFIIFQVQSKHVAHMRWMENTRRAEEMNCELVVVTKPDGSLGRSQSGEVEFLRKSGYKYQERSVRQFAEDVLSVFLADLRAEGEGKSVRIRTSSRCRLPSVPRYMSTEDSDESFSLEVLSGLEVRQSFTLQ